MISKLSTRLGFATTLSIIQICPRMVYMHVAWVMYVTVRNAFRHVSPPSQLGRVIRDFRKHQCHPVVEKDKPPFHRLRVIDELEQIFHDLPTKKIFFGCMDWSNREAVLAKVQESGMQLLHASTNLKADREVVFMAVTNFGPALHNASTEIKADREVVMAAVRNSGSAIHNASTDLQADREVVLTAMRTGGHWLYCVSSTLF